MPGRRKKPFIDKKNAVRFHLVHRSQRDPLQASETSSKHVLLPEISEEGGISKKDQERLFGIDFDDDYDYMQHLRDLNELNEVEAGDSYRIYAGKSEETKTSLLLPSSVFGSKTETDIGLLNKAVPLIGPQPDWDPDIVEALDDDFNFDDPDNILDDNFIAVANAECSDQIVENCSSNGSLFDFDDGFDSDGFPDDSFSEDDKKTHFTNYSCSSSVIRRNDGLTLIDDRFEKIFEEYNEDEIGALDQDDISGHIADSHPLMDSMLKDFEKNRIKIKPEEIIEPSKESESCVNYSGSEEEEEGVNNLDAYFSDDSSEKWDCETILSTYSTTQNHPQKITDSPIRLTKRMQIPADVLPIRGKTLKQIEKDQRSLREMDKASTYRPKDETPEEKKNRKSQIKLERKARRVEKKQNKIAFKNEKKIQEQEYQNLKNNLQGIKIS